MVEIRIGEAGFVCRLHTYTSQFGKHKFRFDGAEHFSVFHEFVEFVADELHPRKTNDIKHHFIDFRAFSIVSDKDVDVLELRYLRVSSRNGRRRRGRGIRVKGRGRKKLKE